MSKREESFGKLKLARFKLKELSRNVRSIDRFVDKILEEDEDSLNIEQIEEVTKAITDLNREFFVTLRLRPYNIKTLRKMGREAKIEGYQSMLKYELILKLKDKGVFK